MFTIGPIHVHVHGDPSVFDRLDQILQALCALTAHTKGHFMAVSAQIQAFSERVNVATNEIAADLQALRDKIAQGQPLSPEDVAVLDGIASRLEAMGVDPENPVPVPEPPPA